MDVTQTFRNDSDSGSELSVDSVDSWFSHQNEVFDGNSMEGRFEDESESDTGADEVMAGPEGDGQTPRRGCGWGRGTRERTDTQFEWEFFADEDPFEQDWLKQFEGNDRPNVDLVQGYPNALSIDYDSLRLYWVDAKMDKIETSDLIGKHRLTLIQQTPHPFGLTVFEDYIYWTDWQTEKLERASKLDGSQRSTIQSKLEGLMDVHMVSAQRQTGTNNCSVNNGGCTHLCLARPDGFVCACPNVEDNKPCETVPYLTGKDRSNVIDIDINPIHECSDEDRAVGICGDVQPQQTSEDRDGEHQQQTGAYIVVAVTLSVFLLVSAVAFLLWKRHRRRNYNVEEFSAMTYANPTYQKASTETINTDNRLGRYDAHFRYNTTDEHAAANTDISTNPTETVALVHPGTSIVEGSRAERGPRATPLKLQVIDKTSSRGTTHAVQVSYKPVVT